MTSQPAGEETPKNVADLATQQTTLDRTALIGVFGTETAPGALMRLPGGKIARVAVGDSVAGGTVLAIGKDQLVLSRLGSQSVLKLPRS